MTRKSEKNRAEEEAKIHAADVGEAVDTLWLTADLYNVEKHMEHSLMKVAMELSDDDKRKKPLMELYMSILNEVRKLRARTLEKIVKNKMFDAWCPFKHLTGAIMQAHEVATREIYKGNNEKAMEFIDVAARALVIFHILNEVAEHWDDPDEFVKWVGKVLGGKRGKS